MFDPGPLFADVLVFASMVAVREVTRMVGLVFEMGLTR
jgi:hypothetical protein